MAMQISWQCLGITAIGYWGQNFNATYMYSKLKINIIMYTIKDCSFPLESLVGAHLVVAHWTGVLNILQTVNEHWNQTAAPTEWTHVA